MSETESPTMDFEDDASTTSTRGSESLITTDNETETEEEENDPWMRLENIDVFAVQFYKQIKTIITLLILAVLTLVSLCPNLLRII
jgi:hypothetical protein